MCSLVLPLIMRMAIQKNSTNADYANNEKIKNLAASGTVTLYAVWESSVKLCYNNVMDEGLKVRVYKNSNSYKDYGLGGSANPTFPVYSGQKIEIYRDSKSITTFILADPNGNVLARYQSSSTGIITNNAINKIYFYVPTNASGTATMKGNYSSNTEHLRLSGWICSCNFYKE